MKLITYDVLEEMMNVHDHYQRTKHVTSADKSNLEKSLNLIKDNFFNNIKNIALEHQQWHKDRKNPPLKLKVKDGAEKRERNSQQSEVRKIHYMIAYRAEVWLASFYVWL